MPRHDNSSSKRLTVMICEDELIVALDLEMMIQEFGFDTLGPFSEVSSALEFVDEVKPDVAVLDVNLKDGQVYPLADKLRDLGVRLVFHSGHADDLEIQERYPQSATCRKPVNTANLRNLISGAVD